MFGGEIMLDRFLDQVPALMLNLTLLVAIVALSLIA